MRRFFSTLLGLAFILCCGAREATAQQYGWVKIAQPANAFISAISFVDSLNGWIGCILADADKSIFRTQDGGYTWERQISPLPPNIQAIGFVDPLHGWIVGDFSDAFGYIIHTSNGGQTWQQQRQLLYRNYVGLGAHNPLEATVTGGLDSFFTTAGLIVRTTNGGQRWQEQRFLKRIGKADFVDGQHGWALAAEGDSGRIIYTADGGQSWTIQRHDNKSVNFLAAIDFVDLQHGWAIGRGVDFSTDPVVIMTRNGGASWEKVYKFPFDGTSPSEGNISFADTLNGWLFSSGFIEGGLAGIIFRTTDGGRNWNREVFSYRLAWPSGQALDLEHVWAGTTTGEVWRYGPLTSVAERADQIIPNEYALLPNYPNPFNPATRIEYQLPKHTRVLLTIYDVVGRKVKTLVDKEQSPGSYRVIFEAGDLSGGTYLYTLKTEAFEQTRSMTLLK